MANLPEDDGFFNKQPADDGFFDKQPKRTLGTNFNDLSIGLTKGLVGLGQGVVGLGDIVSGGLAGKAVKDSGIDLQAIQDLASQSYSPAQREANKAVEDSQGFVGGLKAVAQNPSWLATSFLESAPSMIGGGFAGKAAQKILPALGGIQAGALGEGIIGAGSAAENIRQQDAEGTLGIGQTAAALGTGLVNTVAGQYGSKIAGKLGAKDIDSVLAGTSNDVLTPKNLSIGQAARGVVGGAATEGGEELIQSSNEQLLQNLALGKDAADGVSKAAALGLASGGSMGGAINAANAGAVLATQQARPDTKESAVVQDAANAEKQFLAEQQSNAPQQAPTGDPFLDGVIQQDPNKKVVSDQSGNQNLVDRSNGFASNAVFASGEFISEVSKTAAQLSAAEGAAAALNQYDQTGQIEFGKKSNEVLQKAEDMLTIPAIDSPQTVDTNQLDLQTPAQVAEQVSAPAKPAVDPSKAINAKMLAAAKSAIDPADPQEIAYDQAFKVANRQLENRELSLRLDRLGLTEEQKIELLANQATNSKGERILEKAANEAKAAGKAPISKQRALEIQAMNLGTSAGIKRYEESEISVTYSPKEKKAAEKDFEKSLASGDQAAILSSFKRNQGALLPSQVSSFRDLAIETGDNQGLAVAAPRMSEGQTISAIESLVSNGNVEGFVAVVSNSTSLPKQETDAFKRIFNAVQESGNPDLISAFSEFQARVVEDQQLKDARAQIASGMKMSTMAAPTTLVAQPAQTSQNSPETPDKQAIRLKVKARRVLNSKAAGLGDAFINSPKVKFITSEQAAKIEGTDNAKAFFDSADGSITFIADRMAGETSDNKLFGIILHEAGVHGGKLGKKDGEFTKILSTLESMSKSGNKAAKAAYDRVPSDTPSDLVSEEAMGYFAEQNPEHALTKSFIDYLRKAVRKLVVMLGLNQDKAIVKWANSMSDTELVNAAMDGLRSYLENVADTGGSDGVKKSTTERSEKEQKDLNDKLANAALSGNAELVGKLLDDGANAVTPDSYGTTAIMFAAENGREQVVSVLLPYSNVNAVNGDGDTAVMIAKENGHPQIASLIESYQQAKIDKEAIQKELDAPTQEAPKRSSKRLSSADDHVGDKAKPEQKNKATLSNVEIIGKQWKGFKESWAEFTDKTTIELIDKFADLKPLVASAKDLRDALNPILAISAMHGRRDEMHTRANLEVAAIAKFIKSKGIDVQDLNKYMVSLFVNKDNANKEHRKYAGETGNVESPTGVSDQEAAQIVAEASPAMVEAGKMFRKLIDGNLLLAKNSGIISNSQYDLLTKKYPNYVTLPKQQESKAGAGKGVSVSGKLSFDEGSLTGDISKILEVSAQERAKIIDMAEKNRVATVLAAFVGTYMKPDNNGEEPLVRLDRDNTARNFDPETGYMPMDVGGDSTYTPPQIKRVTDGKVVNDPSYSGRENVITYMIDGQKHHIIFNDQDKNMLRLARNLKNMDDAELGGLLGVIGKITRWISSVNTQYNPAFGPFNFLRDLFYSGITASAMGLDGAKIMINAAKNLGGIMAAEFNLFIDGKVDESNDFRKRYAAAKSKGIAVGFSELVRNNEERAKAIEKSLETGLQWELNAKSISSIGRLIAGSMKAWNTGFENATRMAAYELSLEKMAADVKSGKIQASDAEARSVYNAKNITVDFNRKGASSSVAGALYGFFNSSVQGSVRLKEVLTKEGSWSLSKTGWKVASIAVGVGVLQAVALSAMGFGPNEPDEETLTKFIVIPYISSEGERKTLKLPMPLGLNIFPSTIRNIAQGIIHGDMGSRVGSMFTTVASSFNPVGSSGSAMQILAPTFMDLPIQLTTNEDSFERKIARTDRNEKEKTPGYTRHKDGTSSEAIALSKFINDMTGGSARVAGAWSPTPDQLEHSLAYIFGGIGRTVADIKTLAIGDKNGERGIKNVPVLKRFVSNESSPDKEYQKFSQYTTKLNDHERTLKNAREDGVDQQKYRAENPETKLIQVANIAEKQTKLLSEARRNAKEKGADQEKLREFDAKINDLRSKFNRKYEELRDSNK